MKRLILSMAAMAALFFTACEKDEALSPQTVATTIEAKQIATDNITSEEMNVVEALEAGDPNPAEFGKKKKFNVDSLDATILTYIKNNYATFTPKSAFKDKDGNIYVIVKDAEGKVKILIFDKNNKFIKEATTKVDSGGTSSADSAAVATIKTYLKDKYVGGSFSGIKKEKDGTFTVIVKTKDGKSVIVTFDKDGKFVKETTVPTGGGTSQDSVLISIKNYLNENYKGGGFGAIVKEKDGTYSATVKTKDGKSVIVTFDKNGKFVKQTPVTTGTSATTTIKTYLADKYPDATYGDIQKGKDGGYTVLVKKKDGTSVIVTFDKDGKFVKETAGPTAPVLPDAASTYIKTNYPTGKILSTFKDKDGNFTVTIMTDKGLVIILFDKDGKVLKEIKKK
jgi:predicted  nucleic acid-binding Zn-ribbon protein